MKRGKWKARSLSTAVCRTFLNVLNEEASHHTLFCRFMGTLDRSVNTLPSCALSYVRLSDRRNSFFFFFFFSWKFTMIFLVVFCSVTVACFSASFNVSTGILLQLKRLYFTSLFWSLWQMQSQQRNHFSFLAYTQAIAFHTCLSTDKSKRRKFLSNY